MRTKQALHNIKFAFVLAPLLASCGTGGTTTPIPSTGINLPDCATGQLLGSDSTGALRCVSAPSGNLVISTSCQSGMALTSDGKGLSCVALGTGTVDPGLQARIDKSTNSVTDLTNKATAVQAGGGAKAIYVGSTTATTKGRVEKAGVDTGINAANSLCDDAYKGSHMCNMQEMYYTTVAGKLHMADTIAPAWILFPSWNEPNGTPEGPSEGTSDNCGSMTYPTGDKKWTGILVQWTVLSTGAPGFKFLGGSKAPCNQAMPIACCK